MLYCFVNVSLRGVGTIDLQQHHKSRLISNNMWREIILHIHCGIIHSHVKFSPTLSHSSVEFWLTNKSCDIIIVIKMKTMKSIYIDIVAHISEVYEKSNMKKWKQRWSFTQSVVFVCWTKTLTFLMSRQILWGPG